jgi:hypothetical protein
LGGHLVVVPELFSYAAQSEVVGCFYAIRLGGGVAAGARPARGAKAMTDVLNSLVVYWLMDGGIDKFLVPPLDDILKLQP